MQRRATGRPARLCNLRISAPRPANLSPPPWGSGIVRAPVRAGRFREACRKWGQEAVSDLWSGDRHYVRQASVVNTGRGNPHGSLLRTRKYRRRAPRGCLTKSKTVAGRRPPPVLMENDRSAVRCRMRKCAWGGIATARTRGGMGHRDKPDDDSCGCGCGRGRQAEGALRRRVAGARLRQGRQGAEGVASVAGARVMAAPVNFPVGVQGWLPLDKLVGPGGSASRLAWGRPRFERSSNSGRPKCTHEPIPGV